MRCVLSLRRLRARLGDGLEVQLMPKMRGFKPEIWTDDKFVELDLAGRLLFMGMWNYACDNGHLDDKPKQIKMRVLPTDEVDAENEIDQMVALGMVHRDEGGLTITKLRDHQRLDNRYFTWCDRCSLDEIPMPARQKHPGYTSGAQREHDGDTTSAHVVTREGRKEVKEGERKAAQKRAHQLPSDFEPNDTNRRIAAERGLDLASVVAQFADHHRAKGTTMKDWHLALNTWLRRERSQPGNVQPLRAVAGREPGPGEVADDGTILPPLPKGFFDQ